jgi:hypothetical protein
MSEAAMPGSLIDRLDIALVQRIAGFDGDIEQEMLQSAHLYHDKLFRPSSVDPLFMAALLRLRGFTVQDSDAIEVLEGSSRRLMPASQESQLLFGLVDVLEMMRERASQGRAPDGWFLVELFKTMTRGLPRFRNNALRIDQPWDGMLYVQHPRPAELTAALDRFDYGNRYFDAPSAFDRLHPLRQGFRILWRFARIAPFPDLNVPMAWLAMCSWLLARGYPMLMPESADREAMPRFVASPAPTRMAPWEARMLDCIREGR